MSGERAAPRAGQFQLNWREIGLWSAAGIVMVGLHAGAGWYGYSYQPETEVGDVAAAVMIDMEPLPAPVVPEAVAELPPVEPEQITPEPVQQEAQAPEIQEEKPVEPEPEPQPVEEPTPEEQVVPEEVKPEETVELPKVEVPLPVVKPEPKKPDEPKKDVPKKVVRKPVKTQVADVKADTVTEAKQQPSVSRASAARAAQTWSEKVNSYLARYARRAGGRNRGAGNVRITFTLTRDGNIVSSSITGSSGNPEVDKYALETVRKASPAPAAPDDYVGLRASMTVPITIQ
ncbi:TonB family protein [Phyllobacterium myrsinacearum]|uniref:Protein TonB n=1 Tax=Phyllobacterium myrsinacearum TaxID=28101 RepID=A0A839EKR3_9HYPH|nr:energy transducer TonB [Phyllobacterium myrsinacearum]MBA8879419.1 protein TonB [Phyllobacterium myrsinacearum]